MKPLKTTKRINGDSGDRIMERSGDLVGFSKSRFIWRFGFLPQSDSAKAFKNVVKKIRDILKE